MRQSLATKISITIVGVLALAALSNVVAIGSTYRFEAIQRVLVTENLESVRAAEELEIALLEQRGYVSSYMLDRGNKVWLEELDRHRQVFDVWLVRANAAARSNEERDILDRLERVQRAYAAKRDEVVALYDGGQQEQARSVLLGDVVMLYQDAFDLCEEFIEVNQQLVDAAVADIHHQLEQITIAVTLVMLVTVLLGFVLMWQFIGGVILPLRRIAAEVRGSAAAGHDSLAIDVRNDVLRELGESVHLLVTDIAETRSDLEHSRTQLAHSEKLAAVGKLAASVAHEIRNPLTSIKMWLYSLRRSVGQEAEIQQKFAIVSDEIGRLEGIVRSFLEFSRPPKLKLELQSIGQVIDKTVELVIHRLEGQRITLTRNDEPDLPPISADGEQLQQVFLNLIENAIDATPSGGEIRIAGFRAQRGGHAMVAVRVTDTGMGIPADMQQRIFEPFFTTKDDGTGLGLCIAASVMARHNGSLQLESSDARGTQWIVWFPAASSSSAPRPAADDS